MINSTVNEDKVTEVQNTKIANNEQVGSSVGGCFKEKPFTASMVFLVKSYFAILFGMCMVVAFLVSGAYNAVASLVIKISAWVRSDSMQSYGIEQEDSVCY